MADLPETFAGFPIQIGERRSDAMASAAAWTPREVLIAMLRDIDEGRIKPMALVVCYGEDLGGGKTATQFRSASPDGYTAIGLITEAQHKMISGE